MNMQCLATAAAFYVTFYLTTAIGTVEENTPSTVVRAMRAGLLKERKKNLTDKLAEP